MDAQAAFGVNLSACVLLKLGYVMKIRWMGLSVLALTATALASCATAIRGPNTDFVVITEPPGA